MCSSSKYLQLILAKCLRNKSFGNKLAAPNVTWRAAASNSCSWLVALSTTIEDEITKDVF